MARNNTAHGRKPISRLLRSIVFIMPSNVSLSRHLAMAGMSFWVEAVECLPFKGRMVGGNKGSPKYWSITPGVSGRTASGLSSPLASGQAVVRVAIFPDDFTGLIDFEDAAWSA